VSETGSQERIGAVIVTHGGLADELLAATERIVGPTDTLTAVSIDWDAPVEDARERVRGAIEGLEAAGGVVVFTDMFGGTPTNVCLPFLESGRVEIVAGVNLPMLVKFTNLQGGGLDLAEVVRSVRERGQNSLCIASEVLSAQEGV
jgi:PTS system mannose-specific IIA component